MVNRQQGGVKENERNSSQTSGKESNSLILIVVCKFGIQQHRFSRQ